MATRIQMTQVRPSESDRAPTNGAHRTEKRNRIRTSLLIGLMCVLGVATAVPVIHQRPALGVMAAEFETQEAIVFAWPDDRDWPVSSSSSNPNSRANTQQVTINLIKAVHDRMVPVCLVPNAATQQYVMQKLQDAQLPPDAVRFVAFGVNSVWARDFGPRVKKNFDGTFHLIDTDYYREGELSINNFAPMALARKFEMPVVKNSIALDGGNLLTNGAGVCITTDSRVSRARSWKLKTMSKQLGVRRVVVLQPLFKEATGHVDMFAAFISSDTVVIGQFDKEQDPVNAAILERNALLLKGVRTANGPLKVVRIPMPPHRGKAWYTYTNVVFANGKLLVPTYRNVDPEMQEEAFAVYRSLLPDWDIVGVAADAIIENGGSLHCLSSNLYRVSANPNAGE